MSARTADPSRDPQRLELWFKERGWEVFDFQREAWQAYARGESGLIHAPTGTGKTLAAWGGPLLEALHTPPGGLQYLVITPLRALASDTARNLNRPLEFLDADFRVEVRTGDTSSSVRARQRRTPPRALITTPESLSLMISYKDAAQRLSRLRCVIVDEWHELIGNKRGTLLQLSLARLRSLNRSMRTWGLSATLGNLDEARAALLGSEAAGRDIRGHQPKEIVVDSLHPEAIERFPWAGHLGLKMLPEVMEVLDQSRSSLVFTNTRSQAELWFNAIESCAHRWADRLALHHGSIDGELRARAEQGLIEGTLKAVVATSSLDLGVDFSPVDQVLQIGSPKGVARLIQRAGRSGHQPGATSRIRCVPTHGLELLEIAAARQAIAQGKIEARRPPMLSLDVLAQHLVTCALGGGFTEEAMLAEVRQAYAYRELSDQQWQWTLNFITCGGAALDAYPQFHRVILHKGRYEVTTPRIARFHRMSIGTITSDSAMSVRWVKGGSLGTVEERFIARLRPGDRFLFAGRLLQLVRIDGMVAQVKRAKGRHDTVPRWDGGRLPLSSQLADSMLELLSEVSRGVFAQPELDALRPLLDLQCERSALPTPDKLVVETARSRDGHHIFLYPFAGRAVHEGLGALLGWRLAQAHPVTFAVSINDYGLELSSADPYPLDEALLRRALQPDGLLDDILQAINAAEMSRRHFRDIARIAGLIIQGYPGQQKSARQVQASSGLIFDVLSRYDPGNPLLGQAMREVLEQELEFSRLRDTLAGLQDRELRLIDTERMTPFAFPLFAERLRGKLSSEDFKTRVLRAVEQLER